MGQAPGAGSEPPEDLSCSAGPRAAAWGSAKQRFRSVFAGTAAGGTTPFQLASRELLTAAMQGAIQDLKAVNALGPEAVDECGFGKLCLQLLSFAAIDDPSVLPQLFSGLEQLASPVLTLMLDIPWALLGQTGFPFFGLLAQLNLRKGHVPGAFNSEAVDGLDDPVGRTFQAELTAALQGAGSGDAVEKASAAFLARESKGSALGPLTAMAAQAATVAGVQERVAILQGLQTGFQQVIGNAGELDIALSTQWPLWGLIHVAVDGFSEV